MFFAFFFAAQFYPRPRTVANASSLSCAAAHLVSVCFKSTSADWLYHIQCYWFHDVYAYVYKDAFIRLLHTNIMRKVVVYTFLVACICTREQTPRICLCACIVCVVFYSLPIKNWISIHGEHSWKLKFFFLGSSKSWCFGYLSNMNNNNWIHQSNKDSVFVMENVINLSFFKWQKSNDAFFLSYWKLGNMYIHTCTAFILLALSVDLLLHTECIGKKECVYSSAMYTAYIQNHHAQKSVYIFITNNTFTLRLPSWIRAAASAADRVVAAAYILYSLQGRERERKNARRFVLIQIECRNRNYLKIE